MSVLQGGDIILCDSCGRTENLKFFNDYGLRTVPPQWYSVVLTELGYCGVFHACSIFCEQAIRAEKANPKSHDSR